MDLEVYLVLEAVVSIILTIVIVIQRRLITKLTIRVAELLRENARLRREPTTNDGELGGVQENPSAP